MRKNDCLKTPEWIIEAIGHVDLDPCAAIDTYIGDKNFAIEKGMDGLKLDWSGFVYCNPPFSQKEKWIRKMIEHNNGILLLPERGSAPWFGPLAEKCGKYFVMGKKINFVGGPSSNNIGSVLFPFSSKATEKIQKSGLPGHFVDVKWFRQRTTFNPAQGADE